MRDQIREGDTVARVGGSGWRWG